MASDSTQTFIDQLRTGLGFIESVYRQNCVAESEPSSVLTEIQRLVALVAFAPKQAAASPEIDALVEAILAASSALGDQRIMVTRGRASQEDVAEAYMELQDTIRPLAAAARQAPTGADAVDAERLDWIEQKVCDVSRLGDSARTLRISWNNGADSVFVGPLYHASWRAAVDTARKTQPTRREA